MTSLLSLPFVLFLFSTSVFAQELRTEATKRPDGDTYTVFHLGELNARITSKRPKPEANTYLCVAAAFTRLNDNGIDGLYISNGSVVNQDRINSTLSAGLLIVNDSLSIMDTKRGRLLTSNRIGQISEASGSFFQQMGLVRNGKAETFSDTKPFQRRAVVQFKNGKWAMVENQVPKMLAEFAKDLVSLDVEQALYLDMGAWDEGWYRTENGLEIIGQYKTQTARQSNWLVFYTQK